MRRAHGAVWGLVALAVMCNVVKSHEHAHDHGGDAGHGHDHGHDTRSMYYTPPDDYVEEGAADKHDHDHAGHDHGHASEHAHDHAGHDHGHDTRSMYYTPPDEADEAAAPEKHDHDHAGHDHGHHSGKPQPSHAHSHDHDPTHEASAEGHVHDHGSDCGHDHTMLNSPVNPRSLEAEFDTFLSSFLKDAKSRIWAKALTATAFICCAPILLLVFIPIRDAESSKPLLNVLLSFAAGGLLGDALLHLIPHALNPHDHSGGGHDHDHGHSHGHDHGHGDGDAHDHSKEMMVGLWVLGGILAFMVVEKFVRNLNGGGHGHSHGGHSHGKDDKKVESKKGDAKGKAGGKGDGDEAPAQKEIKVAGYLNLAADFAHNFTDGLTLGAVFLHPEAAPWMTFVAILLHEVPHEIGDFAILIQSGCTPFQAMRLQLVTAIGAMSGTVVGLMSEDIGTANSQWILPFTAGGFIYIATVGVIPELLEDAGLWQSIKEVLAFVAGVGTMVFIMFFE